MKKIIIWCLVVLPILLSAQGVSPAGKQLFVGYLAAGMNVTQIAGDIMAGYRKVGGNAGVGAYIMYKPQFSNSIELSYSMKGSQENFKNNNPLNFKKFSFDYVEIPVLFNYHEADIAIFHAGATFGRLIRYNINQSGGLTLPDDPKKWDFAATLGMTFLVKDRFGLNFKANFSLNSLWELAVASSRARRGGWYHNTLAFRFIYLFKPK
jgi:hypothetical protein|tara:strand:- start:885 stop:1508 length:624 start_codon:yes stop_codon:yes gene_type:complete